MQPEIKILAVSNVYCRLMNFKKAGDFEQGHYHTYDHGTLLTKGKLLVEKTDHNGNVTSSKEFTAPTFLYIENGHRHILTALEDNTLATCIHALRTIEETIVDSSFLIDETVLANSDTERANGLKAISEVMADRGMQYLPVAFEFEQKEVK
jgi:hypothetical protein